MTNDLMKMYTYSEISFNKFWKVHSLDFMLDSTILSDYAADMDKN